MSTDFFSVRKESHLPGQIILIGTSHTYQYRHEEAQANLIEQFKQLLLWLCSTYAVIAIAEEMNEEALAEGGASESVAQEVAKELNVRHQFSDPSRTLRRQLGVLQENDIRAGALLRAGRNSR